MELNYRILDSNYSDCNTKGLTGLVEDAFTAIQEQGKDKELRDLSILFYLQNIESVEISSFQILQMAAVKLKDK
jgi:ferritin-like metal-binding protein YciE